MRKLPIILATSALIAILCAHSALAGSTIVIIFKDGTKVTADLPQDSCQIASIGFEGPAPVAEKPNASGDLTQVVLRDTLDGGLGANWDALACVGGNYSTFAKFEGGKLVVNVPAGNHWGKTGIMSKKPLFTVDNTMDERPMKVVLDFEPARTAGYVVCLAPVEHVDVWLTQNAWLHRGLSSTTKKGFTYLTNTQNSNDPVDPKTAGDMPVDAPGRVTLSVSAGVVAADISGKILTLRPSWLKSGTPVYLHIFSHPEGAGGPASFALDTITVGR